MLDSAYRSVAGDNTLPSLQNPKAAFEEALTALGKTKLDPSELLIVDGAMERKVAGALQQSWSTQLSAYINVQPLAQADLLARVKAGNYQIALVPFTPSYSKPDSMLADFMSDASGNLCGYSSEEYDRLVLQGMQANDPPSSARYFYQAENQLVSSATVVPLYNTATYYAMAKKVTGIQFSPFQGKTYFKYGAVS